MKTIKITVSGNSAIVTEGTCPVSGTVGLPVAFAFDQTWDGLEVTAVFRVNGKTYDRLNARNGTTVPWELLQKPGCQLYCGVFGTAGDGSLQIPTVWVELGIIQPGADPSGDESADPTLPVWQQVTADIEKALDEILELQAGIISGRVIPRPSSEGGDGA